MKTKMIECLNILKPGVFKSLQWSGVSILIIWDDAVDCEKSTPRSFLWDGLGTYVGATLLSENPVIGGLWYQAREHYNQQYTKNITT